ncbi:PQQ-binding-like beta-propeller repeat protein [Cellulomonas sp.]|uniref:outer membrane protein assembly factor BamB family protein n=1 Tax=Cellulomonas sp. TaxID=40001 RepID=UPI003BAA0A97
MARGSGMQEVELLDGDEPDTEPDTEQPGTPARGRRGLRWVVAGGVAVALSLVGTQWVVDARENAAIARLSAVPGVVPAFGDELTVARTLPPGEISSLWSGIESVGGATASLVVAADGSQAFAAVDQRTGETIWSTPLLGPNAERAASRESAYGGGCQSDARPHEVATVAVCLVTDGFTRYGSDDGTDERVPATTTRAVVLDPTDGRVLSDRALDTDAQLVVLPGLLLVGTRDAERIEIVASDLRTGDERWRHEEPREDERGTGDTEQPSLSWSFFRAGDVVVFSLREGGGLGVLSSTGESVRDDLRPAPTNVGYGTDPATGDLLVFHYGVDGTQTTTLLAADADPAADVVLEGGAMDLGVDDGSVPGLVLTSRERVHGWDRRTGDHRWESDVQSTGSALLVRGRVYLSTASGLAALDGRTGEVVWQREVPVASVGSLATDGRDLLMSSTSGDAALGSDGVRGGMTGYDLATGEQTRHVPYPEGVGDVMTHLGLLLGWSPESGEVLLLE